MVPPSVVPNAPTDRDRPVWLGALAHASADRLEAELAALLPRPSYQMLRAPEIGMVMVRGQMGGTGAPFNMGEMTVTRCSVETTAGMVGHGYVAGRAPRHAELIALFDALFQDEDDGPALRESILPGLDHARREGDARATAEAAETKVDFFTLVRGEDEAAAP